MNEKNETFTYTYCAAQQEEIAAIRRKYLPPREDKMETLRKLDAGVTRKGMALSLTVGILGALTMGGGMSLIMTDLGAKLGVASPVLPGLLLGILGLAGAIGAYPVYQWVTRRQRQRIAPEILRLTQELTLLPAENPGRELP